MDSKNVTLKAIIERAKVDGSIINEYTSGDYVFNNEIVEGITFKGKTIVIKTSQSNHMVKSADVLTKIDENMAKIVQMNASAKSKKSEPKMSEGADAKKILDKKDDKKTDASEIIEDKSTQPVPAEKPEKSTKQIREEELAAKLQNPLMKELQLVVNADDVDKFNKMLAKKKKGNTIVFNSKGRGSKKVRLVKAVQKVVLYFENVEDEKDSFDYTTAAHASHKYIDLV